MKQVVILKDETINEKVDVVLEKVSPSTLYLTVCTTEGEDHFTVALDFFNGKLRALVWSPEEQGGDPGVEVECSELWKILPPQE